MGRRTKKQLPNLKFRISKVQARNLTKANHIIYKEEPKQNSPRPTHFTKVTAIDSDIHDSRLRSPTTLVLQLAVGFPYPNNMATFGREVKCRDAGK